ncbi:MAG: immunity 26/phosphotriesterase HocA family protein [Actinomycetia bacterium]|nr:immunity 26/phosphotriesterase HocA family protein [Actinomycetes bacterium]
MLCFNENVLLAARQHRHKQLPQAIQDQLQALKEKRIMTDELLFIKRKNAPPKKGDIFLVQPQEGVYFYGCVLDTEVSLEMNPGVFDWRNAIVVALFVDKTKELTLGKFFPSENNLLTLPQIVIPSGWRRGYFFTVGHVDPSEIVIDYGFVEITKVSAPILDSRGQALDRVPRHLVVLACGDVGAVAVNITRELIMSPWLLDFDVTPPAPYPPLQAQTEYLCSFPVTEC